MESILGLLIRAAADENKSIGSSVTLPRDIANQSELFSVLENLSKGVSQRLKAERLFNEKCSRDDPLQR